MNKRSPIPNVRHPVLWVVTALSLAVAGCSTMRFSTGFCVDPKPLLVGYHDLKRPAEPQPVYLVFDMYSEEGSFPEATRKLGPKVVRVLKDSRMFSSVSAVGSENIAAIQLTMRETPVADSTAPNSLPAGLTSGLPGSQGAVAYQFTATYKPPGKPPVKKTYPHAVHVLGGKAADPFITPPMTAAQAVDAILEQVTLTFLRDLQREGKL
jgi:hypothetical protein